MGRLFALDTEVVWRCHDASTHVMLPDAIDDDAAGQRMIGLAQPASELRSLLSALRFPLSAVCQCFFWAESGKRKADGGRKARLDALARPAIIAGPQPI